MIRTKKLGEAQTPQVDADINPDVTKIVVRRGAAPKYSHGLGRGLGRGT